MLRIMLLDLLAIPLLLGRLVIFAVNNHRVIVTLRVVTTPIVLLLGRLFMVNNDRVILTLFILRSLGWFICLPKDSLHDGQC